MTLVFSASINPTSTADVFYQFKTFMINNGYVVVSSSNGATLQAGDIITSTATLTSSIAYFILKQPLAASASYGGYRREWCFRMGGSTNKEMVTVSYTVSGAHTTGGTINAIPTGPDFKYAFERTDASFPWQTGQSGSLFPQSFTGSKVSFCADNSSPFGWYLICINTASALVNNGLDGCLIFDPMITGSFNLRDTDPYVSIFQGSIHTPLRLAVGLSDNLSSTMGGARAWNGKSLSVPRYSKILLPDFYIYQNSTQVPISGSLTSNAITGGDDTYPVFYYRPSHSRNTAFFEPNSGLKGYSFFLQGLVSSTTRRTGDTYTVNTTNDYIVVNDYILPWNSTDPLV